jgi:hypothetical protein
VAECAETLPPPAHPKTGGELITKAKATPPETVRVGVKLPFVPFKEGVGGWLIFINLKNGTFMEKVGHSTMSEGN